VYERRVPSASTTTTVGVGSKPIGARSPPTTWLSPPSSRSPDKGAFFARTHPVRSSVLGIRVDGPAPQGMYLAADTPSRSARSAPIDGGQVVLVGGESHKVGQDDDTAQRYRSLEDWARRQFPVRSVDYRWSAQDYLPVDRLPFVGPLSPGSERILVATGFQKWGMSNGTAVAMMLVDRIIGNDNP